MTLDRSNPRKVPFFLPNIITALGLLLGLLVIFKMSMTEPGSSDYALIYSASILLLLSAIADFADGLVARWMRAQTPFGLIFDSLNDAITFGVAPAVVVLKTLSPESKTLFSLWATAAAMVFCLGGVLRLVRYSGQKQLSGSCEQPSRYFTGLPIPAACSALVSLTLFLSSELAHICWSHLESLRATCLVIAQFLLGFLMISRWRFPAPVLIRLEPSPRSTLCWALGTALFLFLYSHHVSLAFVATSWSYVLGSWSVGLFYWITGRRERALAPRCDWMVHPGDEEKAAPISDSRSK